MGRCTRMTCALTGLQLSADGKHPCSAATVYCLQRSARGSCIMGQAGWRARMRPGGKVHVAIGTEDVMTTQ